MPSEIYDQTGDFFIYKNQHNWKQKDKIQKKTAENTKTKQKRNKKMCDNANMHPTTLKTRWITLIRITKSSDLLED